MNNSKKIILVTVVLFIFGISAYFLLQKPYSSVPAVNNGTIIKQDGVAENKNNGDSRYVEYSKTALNNASTKRRVLFFYASWCSTCRPADASFKASINEIPEDMVVIRVNYNDPETDNEEKELARKYGITYQHTFVQIDNLGQEITKWNGGNITELLANSK
jgi:thioredoxin 1